MLISGVFAAAEAASGATAPGVGEGVAAGCGAGDGVADGAVSAAAVGDAGCELTVGAGDCPEVCAADWPAVCPSIAQLQDLALQAVQRSNHLASRCLSPCPVVRLVFAALEEALHSFARAPVQVSDV